MSIEIINTTYPPVDGQCEDAEYTPTTCSCYSLSIERKFEIHTNTFLNTIKVTPLFTPQALTCGPCAAPQFVLDYLYDGPTTKTLSDLISDPSMQTTLLNAIRNNSGSIMVCTGGTTTPPSYNQNLLILFNINNCAVNESIVSSEYYYDLVLAPETIVIRYVKGVSRLLSESNPEEFRKLVREYETKYNCNKGTCCFILQDSDGHLHHGCEVVGESYCSVEGMTQFYANDPTFIGRKIVSTLYNPAIDSCNLVDCSWELPLPKVLGTCCIPGYAADGGWGCVINSREECVDQLGFWEAPQPDGLGGFNAPSCTDRGVQVVAIDSTDSATLLLGPRDCSLLGPSKPDVPPVNPGGDVYDPPSACCWWVPSRSVTETVVSNSLIHTKTVKKVFVDKSRNNEAYPIDITLSLLNDGSTIKLCFPSYEILNQLYPINTTEAARNTKIESEFSIKDINSDNQLYKVQFKKIEGSCIILTTTRA